MRSRSPSATGAAARPAARWACRRSPAAHRSNMRKRWSLRLEPPMAAMLAASLLLAPVLLAGTAAADRIPHLDGKPDFSGISQTTSAAGFALEPHSTRKDAPPGAGIVAGNVIPYLPAALEQKKKNFAARDTSDPR